MTNKKELFFDVIILGSGPAGFSAAIYASRGNLKTAIIDISMFGGQPSNYLEIEIIVFQIELLVDIVDHLDLLFLIKIHLQLIDDLHLNSFFFFIFYFLLIFSIILLMMK